MQAVYNHFSNSPARNELLQVFQDLVDIPILKILSPGQTRWLSLKSAVDRYKVTIPALVPYCKEQLMKITSAKKRAPIERILHFIQHQLTVPYLEMLSYSLGELTDFNTIFQAEAPQLYALRKKVDGLIKTFATNFMHGNYVVSTSAQSINPLLANQYVTLENIYFGMFFLGYFLYIFKNCNYTYKAHLI